MRSYQVLGSLSPERAAEVMRTLKEAAPGMFAQALAAAATAFKARPVYFARQPLEKQAAAIRSALARVTANPVAEELLAVYFLECKKELLVEWLDSLEIKHEDGTLEEDSPPQPPKAKLAKAVKAFRKQDDGADRELLLAAFAAQSAIDWPDLEALVGAGPQ
jgi:hypothetical protein